MKYNHCFRVKAPLSEVAAFHRQAGSMSAITPPPLHVQIHHAPEPLSTGDEMDFSLHFGPLSLHWIASIDDVSETGFTDRQLVGPFQTWMHRHSFTQINADNTQVNDQINAQLKRSLFGGLIGLIMWLGLPLLFAYRGWKTRSLLEQ